ncbi:hypothetical protein BH24CHL1_BH24CHL1_08260 [soil metagenome]
MSGLQSTNPATSSNDTDSIRVRPALAILLGLLSLIATLGLWWIGYAAGFATFPPFDLTDIVIRRSPGELAVWAIANLQFDAQRLALLGGIVAWLVLGAVLALGLRQRPTALTGATIGVTTALLATVLAYVSNNASGVGFGIWLLIWFGVTLAGPLAVAGNGIERLQIDARDRSRLTGHGDWIDQPSSRNRRDVLKQAIGGALAFGIGGWTIGSLLRKSGVAESQIGAGEPIESVRTSLQATPSTRETPPDSPTPPTDKASPASPEPTGTGLDDVDDFDPPAGVRPRITSTEDFYTIDISTRDPVIQREQWTLRIGGLVNQEIVLTYNDLLSMPSIELPGTLMCISYTYGSELISTTRWSGVRLRDVLQMAGIGDGAVELVLRGGGGYSDSIQVSKALEETTLLAYGMDGETLSREHGFPCRLYVPNIYGEKNVKWIEEIEVVDYDYTGFWQERGWDANNTQAVINILSVIDTPLGDVAADESGTVPIGGVAFAGSRGIQSVQIQVDGGQWVDTTVEPYEPALVWQRWKYAWPAESGEHTLTVRATDGEGNEQVTVENPPFPDGMTGLQEVNVQVL